MRQARESPTLVSCLGKLYALGGRDEFGTLASVEVYDPTTNQWSADNPMVYKCHPPTLFTSLSLNVILQRQPRSAAAGVALGEQIYIIGGEGRGRPGMSGRHLLSVERLDIPSGSWKKVIMKLI